MLRTGGGWLRDKCFIHRGWGTDNLNVLRTGRGWLQDKGFFHRGRKSTDQLNIGIKFECGSHTSVTYPTPSIQKNYSPNCEYQTVGGGKETGRASAVMLRSLKKVVKVMESATGSQLQPKESVCHRNPRQQVWSLCKNVVDMIKRHIGRKKNTLFFHPRVGLLDMYQGSRGWRTTVGQSCYLSLRVQTTTG